MYPLIRSLLFRLDPETSHDLALRLFALASRLPSTRKPAPGTAETEQFPPIMGIRFPNPIGLAAGLDKQGTARDIFRRLGFGFVEVGTVTPKPQPGNPKPRMFRLMEHQALINRMGFNSVGVAQFKKNLAATSGSIVTGINIGKNATTPINEAIGDYLTCLREVYTLADYIAINVSSPNTEGLRQLQDHELLDALLASLNRERECLSDRTGSHKPLVIKVAPDLDDSQVNAIAALMRTHSIDGIIATNTTVSRSGIANHPFSVQAGGLSGAPLRQSSTYVVKLLHDNLQDEIPIIGVGGIHDPESALEKFEAGARLIQLYTGLIYSGPTIIKRILDATGKIHRP